MSFRHPCSSIPFLSTCINILFLRVPCVSDRSLTETEVSVLFVQSPEGQGVGKQVCHKVCFLFTSYTSQAEMDDLYIQNLPSLMTTSQDLRAIKTTQALTLYGKVICSQVLSTGVSSITCVCFVECCRKISHRDMNHSRKKSFI